MEVRLGGILEGFKHYVEIFLFVRPVKRIVKRFIKRILMRRPYVFGSWNVFMDYNRDVIALLVDGSRYYDYTWRYRGEENIIKLFKCLLKMLEYGVFVDVGTYVGFYTVLAARHGWRVVAFEPNPINLVLLRYNIALHKIGDRVVIVDKAAGDVHGYARFQIASSPSESSFAKFLRDELKLLSGRAL
jgi:hypothetical protein